MALWTPSAISTALWLDAADSSTLFASAVGGSGSVADGAVSRWEDKSGSGRHVSQSNLGQAPIRKTAIQNSLDVVRFDSAGLLNNNAQLLRNVSGYSFFFAGVSTTATAERTMFAVSTSANNARFVAAKLATSGFLRVGGRRTVAQSFSAAESTVNLNTAAVVSCVANHSATTITSWANGTQAATNTSWHDAGTTENDAGGAFVAFNAGSSSNFFGDIFELVLVHQSMAVADRQIVEGYLAWKWGLQGNLPADHPYKNAAPAIGGGIIPIIRQHYAAMGAR
jgi:hypothetical protein